MHLSMHNWMRAEPIEKTIARLAEYGYQSIEISGEPEKYDTAHVRDLLDEHDIECWGSVSLMFEGRDLIHEEEEVRDSSVQYIKDCITMVKELDGQIMTIVPTRVGKIDPMDTPENEWNWAVEGLQAVNDHAKKEGIQIALEPLNRFESYFMSRHDQALLLAEEVGPNCGVCLDTFHMNIEEADYVQAIRNVGDRLVDFHVADNNRMAPGQGSYDWSEVVNALNDIGYDGALTVEFVAPVDRTPANPYENAVGEADAEISEEQEKFIKDHGSGKLSDEFYSRLVKETADTLLPLIT